MDRERDAEPGDEPGADAGAGVVAEQQERRADEAAEQAWARFRARLADRLDVLEEGGDVYLEAESWLEPEWFDGEEWLAPYVVVVHGRPGVLRAELSGPTRVDRPWSRLRFEPPGFVPRFRDLGWQEPTGDCPNWWIEVPQREVDRLAVLVVEAVRWTCEVAHPMELRAGGLELDPLPDPAPSRRGGVDVDAPDAVRSGEPPMPRGADDLTRLVVEALERVTGRDIELDEDGDVPFGTDSTVVYVHADERKPVIDLWALLVVDAGDPWRLPMEVGLLNRAHPDYGFVVLDDGRSVEVRRRLQAAPFVADHLCQVLVGLLREVDGLARDLALRVVGRRPLDPEPEGPGQLVEPARTRAPVRNAYLALVELAEDESEPLPTAEQVARLYDHRAWALTDDLACVRRGLLATEGADAELVAALLVEGLRVALRRESAAEMLEDPSADGSRG